jgi:hypothetical protein
MKKYIPCLSDELIYLNKDCFNDALKYYLLNYSFEMTEPIENCSNHHFYIEFNDNVDEMWKEYREKYILRDIIE